MRYSTYAEKEEDDNEFLRDEDLLHLSQQNFSNSDEEEEEEFEDRLMQNTDEVVTQ